MELQVRGQLVALAAAQIDDNGRQWIEVLPTAEKVRNGPWYMTIGRDDLATWAEFVRQNPDRIPVDYDHAGDKQDGSTVAAGWFTGQADVRDTENGPRLVAEVEWTPQALEEIRSRRFRFISAVMSFINRDAKTGLLTKAKALVAATLTNRPFFRELAPVASDLIDSATLDLLAAQRPDMVDLVIAGLNGHEAAQEAAKQFLSTLTTNEGDDDMSDSMKVHATALGLAADATDEQIAEAINAKNTELEAAQAKISELESKVLSEDQVKDLVAQAAAGAQAAKELGEIKVETMLTDAIRAGKILPVQKDAYQTMARADYDGVKALLDATPEKAFREVGAGGDADASDDAKAAREVEEAVRSAKADGIDEDSVKVDVRARKILADKGKDPDECTLDEYAAAAVKAERELVTAGEITDHAPAA